MSDEGETVDEGTGPAGTFRARVIHQGDDPGESPRGFDGNVSVIVADSDYYAYPAEDPDMLDMLRNRDVRVTMRYQRIFGNATVVLPLYQGADGALSPGNPEDDGAGAVGLAYDTPETRKYLGDDPTPEQVRAAIVAELDEYRAWATGEVYGVAVDRLVGVGTDPVVRGWSGPVWETVDDSQVWGHIGYDWACEAARDALAAEIAAPLDDQPAPFPAAPLAVRVAVLAERWERSYDELTARLPRNSDGDVVLYDSEDVETDALAEVYGEAATELRKALANSV